MSGALNAANLFKTTLFLTGGTLNGWSISGGATAGVRINTDGTVDQNENGSYSQIHALTDWIRPVGRASSSYQVRITNVVWTSGSAFDFAAAAEDTWIALSANREWNVVDATDGPTGVKDVSFDIEIRKGSSGAADVSGGYTLNADFDSDPP